MPLYAISKENCFLQFAFCERWLKDRLNSIPYFKEVLYIWGPDKGTMAAACPALCLAPGEPLQPHSPSQYSSTTHRCGFSPIRDFVLHTGFHVSPSLYYQTYVLWSAELQTVRNFAVWNHVSKKGTLHYCLARISATLTQRSSLNIQPRGRVSGKRFQTQHSPFILIM